MEALKIVVCFLLVFISGCSEIVPVTLSESQKVYVGVWHYFHEVKTNSSFDIKKVVLSINSDSTAIYKTCSVVVKKESIAKSSSSSSIFLDSAIVTQIDQTEISLVQETEIINLNYDLLINKKPYKKNGAWQMVIDNVLLSRLDSPNINELTAWSCPESEDIQLGVEKT